jgi:predicted protein tyrosine phosphatase
LWFGEIREKEWAAMESAFSPWRPVVWPACAWACRAAGPGSLTGAGCWGKGERGKSVGPKVPMRERTGEASVLAGIRLGASVASMKKRILFLCSQNKLRSPTAEAVFAGHPTVEVDSAGLNNDAEVPLSEEQVECADLILVMENAHRSRLNRKFGKSLAGKRVVVLNIPDDYDYMDPALIDLLKQRCAPYIP